MTAWWYKKDAFFYNNKYKENIHAQEELQDARIIGIFFGMYLSRPDRLFAQHLAKFHDNVRSIGGKFHIIFCSMDQNEKDCQDFVQQFHGRWLVIPWSHQSARRAAKNQCNNLGHPSLVVFRNDGEGVLLSVDGKDEFEDYGGGAFGLWQEMATGSYVSEEAAVKKKSTKGIGSEVDDDDEEMMGPSYEDNAGAKWNATEEDINRGRGASLEFDAEARELAALEGRRASAMSLTHDPDQEDEGEEEEGDEGPPQPAVVLAFPKRLSDADYELEEDGGFKKRSTDLEGEPLSDFPNSAENLVEDDSGQQDKPTENDPSRKASDASSVSKKSSKDSLEDQPRDPSRTGSQGFVVKKNGSGQSIVGESSDVSKKRSSASSIVSKAPVPPSIARKGSGESAVDKSSDAPKKASSASSIVSKAPTLTKNGSDQSVALKKQSSASSIVSKAPTLAKQGSSPSVVGESSHTTKKLSGSDPLKDENLVDQADESL